MAHNDCEAIAAASSGAAEPQPSMTLLAMTIAVDVMFSTPA